MKVALLLLIVLVANPISAIRLCDQVTTSYSISTYQGNCIYGNTNTYTYNVTADHEVLRLNTTTGLFEFVDIIELSIGDVVQSAFGTTTITGLSATTITAPYLSIGQIFSYETLYSPTFNPYAISPYARWISTEDTTMTSALMPFVVSSYVNTDLIIDYHVPELTNDQFQVLLGTFNSSMMVSYGSISCNGTTRDIYYYDGNLLTANLALDVLYRSFRVMAMEEYFKMVDYALSQPDGMYFDGIEMIYDYSVVSAPCSALDITTADGYLVVNEFVLN